MEEINIDLNRLENGLLDASEQLSILTNDLNTILVVGATGAGKSTFIGYFQGHEMERRHDERFREIIDYRGERPDGAPVIGHTINSETDAPQIYTTGNREYCVCDTAGFMDTREVERRIINSVSIKLAINNSDRIQGLVCVVSFEDLFSRRIDRLSETFHHLNTLLPNYEDYLGALTFVITQLPSHLPKEAVLANIRGSIHDLEINRETLRINQVVHRFLVHMRDYYESNVFIAQFDSDEGALIYQLEDRFRQSEEGIPTEAIQIPLTVYDRAYLEQTVGQIVYSYQDTLNSIENINITLDSLKIQKIALLDQISETEHTRENYQRHRVIYTGDTAQLYEKIGRLKERTASMEVRLKEVGEQIILNKSSIKAIQNDDTLVQEGFCHKSPKTPRCKTAKALKEIEVLKEEVETLKIEKNSLSVDLDSARHNLILTQNELALQNNDTSFNEAADLAQAHIEVLKRQLNEINLLKAQHTSEKRRLKTILRDRHELYALVYRLNDFFYFEQVQTMTAFFETFDPAPSSFSDSSSDSMDMGFFASHAPSETDQPTNETENNIGVA